MRVRMHGRLAALLAIGQVLCLSHAVAQSNEELNGTVRFNFPHAGRAELAMGRAFTGLADDATAAYANPAGLLWLSRPEVSIEGRRSEFTTEYFSGGRVQRPSDGNRD